MAQTYTLEEAALRLGITADEMKRRLKEDWKTLRSFRDGPTLRFRAADIDELARSLGAASDPGLQLAPMADAPAPGSDDFKVPDAAAAPLKPAPAEEPLVFGGSTDEDIFSLSPDSSSIVGKPPAKGDSDVRLEAAGPKSGKHKKGDSDARIDPKDKPKKGDSDTRLKAKDKAAAPDKDDQQAVVPTEEISVDFSGPGSAVIKGGSSAKLSAPKSSSKLTSGDSGRSLSNPGVGDSSEFELSLDADSSDFELQLNAESSDEVDLGEPAKDAGKKSGQSGINLRDPADSGISLEKKGKPKSPKEPDTDSDSDVDFELSLDAPSPASGPKLTGPKSGPRAPATSDSDSEFELTLDDSGEGSSLEAAAMESAEANKADIFETDFEIPPMDESGSEAVAVESDTDLEKSDFDLATGEGSDAAEDDTGSQVVLLEEEDEAPRPAPKGRGKKKPAADVEEVADVDLDSGEADVAIEEEESDAAAALKGAKGRRRPAAEEEEEEEAVPAGAVAAPAPWGVVPLIGLVPTFFIVLLGGLMGYELIHTMYGYQQPRAPAAPLVRGVASTLDMDVKGQ